MAKASAPNKLHYGDNLSVLKQHVAAESVDLVYLDPPFNSNRAYNVIFKRHDVVTEAPAAQIQAFDDTWRWTTVTEDQYDAYVGGELAQDVAEALRAYRTLLGENDAMAYLVNMAPRLVEMHRVLKPTGTLYLHCDPTMSHYLKVLLDALFGATRFRSEIIWQRTAAKGLSTTRVARNHDVILSYGKSDDVAWNPDAAFQPYDEENLDEKTEEKYALRDAEGRRYQLTSLINPNADRPNLTYEFLGVTRVWRWTKERMQEAYDLGLVVQPSAAAVPRYKRYLDEQRGKPLSDVWSDISPINARAVERLGYPTQKPVALLERILSLSTNEDDLVLDPFCGCGTSIDAAVKLNRRWIGIDVTYLSVDLIEKRLEDRYGAEIKDTYDVSGIPRDKESALRLFSKSALEFERWAVSMLNAVSGKRQSGDEGIDGTATFPLGSKKRGVGRILVSVKGGQQVNPAMVRDLHGTVTSNKAEMGVLILMKDPTPGMVKEANKGGSYIHPANAEHYPKIQMITVSDLLSGKRPKLPPTHNPYKQAAQAVDENQGELF